MEQLASKKCGDCHGGKRLSPSEQGRLLDELNHGWRIVDNHHLEKQFDFKNFVQALEFTNKIGGIAEEQGHHPDIYLTWGKVRVQIYTHSANGLTESDFILAARIEKAH